MEWLYDTLDDTTPSAGGRPRRGMPCASLLILFFGLLILGAVAFLLIGPPLPAAEEPTPTATPGASAGAP